MTTLVTGGGFDVFHDNHRAFLTKLIELTTPSNIIFFLSSDLRLNLTKGKDRPLFTYEWRKQDIINWCPIDIEIISMDYSKEVFSNYGNKSGYIIGTKQEYKNITVNNLITINEIGNHHTSDILTKLTEAERNSECALIKVGSVLLRNGNIITSSSNGTQRIDGSVKPCNKCTGDIKNKCKYYHAEELSLQSSKSNDDILVSYSPCINCAKLIVEKRIRRVIYKHNYVYNNGVEYLIDNGIQVRKIGM